MSYGIAGIDVHKKMLAVVVADVEVEGEYQFERRLFSLRAIATLAIFRPRRIARWKDLLRHSGSLRTVTWAASTNRKRNRVLPCFVMWPSRRRCPLDSSNGTSPR